MKDISKENNKKVDTEKVFLRGNKRTAMCGVFMALSMILSYLESLVPISFAVPGIKLGLANLVTIIALIRLGILDTIVISIGRIILSGILFGNPMVIIYSLAGAACSILIMCLINRLKFFSVTGVSVCGAISHNFGQLIVAAIVLNNANILYYMVVLSISGLVAGTVIGMLAASILKNIRFN